MSTLNQDVSVYATDTPQSVIVRMSTQDCH